MLTSLLIPLDGGFDHHGPPFAPFLGGLMTLLFLMAMIGGALFLARKGRLGTQPPWARQGHSPETEAKKILAERFARGDISTEEFMERASVLNWTPGSDAHPPQKPKKPR